MKWIHPNDTHPMKEIVGAEVFNEVIRLDRYGIREFNRRHKEYEVLTVVDVGANVGYFSVMASCLFPSTKRIAI